MSPHVMILYLRLGRGDISLDGYILRPAKDSDKSLCKNSPVWPPQRRLEPGSDAPAPSPARINTKEIYHLHCGGADQNFIFPDCCRPIPGDDVMGFINDAGQVEVHSLTCPRAQVLKASFGNRILATAWDVVQQKFRAEILIGGIDRHGILSELTAMISTQLGIDIRALNIAADKEVFECRLGVMVDDTGAVDSLCAKSKENKGRQERRQSILNPTCSYVVMNNQPSTPSSTAAPTSPQTV